MVGCRVKVNNVNNIGKLHMKFSFSLAWRGTYVFLRIPFSVGGGGLALSGRVDQLDPPETGSRTGAFPGYVSAKITYFTSFF